MMKLVEEAVNYRNCSFIADPVTVVEPILKMLKQNELPEEILLSCSEIGASLLMSPLIRLSQAYANLILLKVYTNYL